MSLKDILADKKKLPLIIAGASCITPIYNNGGITSNEKTKEQCGTTGTCK